MKAEGLMEKIFHPHRSPRSAAYREGCLAALRYNLLEAMQIVCPYDPGTAEFDAFWAGADEGRDRASGGEMIDEFLDELRSRLEEASLERAIKNKDQSLIANEVINALAACDEEKDEEKEEGEE